MVTTKVPKRAMGILQLLPQKSDLSLQSLDLQVLTHNDLIEVLDLSYQLPDMPLQVLNRLRDV